MGLMCSSPAPYGLGVRGEGKRGIGQWERKTHTFSFCLTHPVLLFLLECIFAPGQRGRNKKDVTVDCGNFELFPLLYSAISAAVQSEAKEFSFCPPMYFLVSLPSRFLISVCGFLPRSTPSPTQPTRSQSCLPPPPPPPRSTHQPPIHRIMCRRRPLEGKVGSLPSFPARFPLPSFPLLSFHHAQSKPSCLLVGQNRCFCPHTLPHSFLAPLPSSLCIGFHPPGSLTSIEKTCDVSSVGNLKPANRRRSFICTCWVRVFGHHKYSFALCATGDDTKELHIFF